MQPECGQRLWVHLTQMAPSVENVQFPVIRTLAQAWLATHSLPGKP